MSKKDLRALARRFFDECNKGKAAAIAAMDEFYATDVIVHSGTGEDLYGLKDYKRYMNDLFTAFPDAYWTIDDQIVEGNKKAARLTMTGTHKGELMGMRSTNKKVRNQMISFSVRDAAGKVVEEWLKFDTLGFMQQLGVIPTPKK